MFQTSVFDQITGPSLVLDAFKTRRNIWKMTQKVRNAGVRFRPHFKTHQSAQIGDWFRQEGVTCITVSSLEMAQYFANHGWQDITIAFSVNLRQIPALDALAGQIKLGLLVESQESVQALAKGLHHSVDVWIKIDTGAHRTGLPWDQPARILPVLEQITSNPGLNLKGFLTHSGNTYGGVGKERIQASFRDGVDYLNNLRSLFASQGFEGLEISVGDTPGCTLCPDFSAINEVRPGNFVFYDAMQAEWGVCDWHDIAVVAACPVVAKHPERNTLVLYGGAIHLSKDFYEINGERCYGRIGLPDDNGWSDPLDGARLINLSQEHGIARVKPEHLEQIQIGDLVCIYPAHSCLSVSALGRYISLSGELITAFSRS